VPPKPYLAPLFVPAAPLADATVKTLTIPGYSQVRQYTCGYASALMVLHYFRRFVPGRTLYERLGTNHTGTSQNAMVRELRRSGIAVNIRYDLNLDVLRRAIDRNKLVVGYHHRLEHWVVLYGYGRDPDRVFVADPLRHLRHEHLWSCYGPKLDGFGIVCSARRSRRRTEPVSAVASCAAA
jgi:ABC-type bacteriocin/lantibiotic exporter with double-glycine peptidase domain